MFEKLFNPDPRDDADEVTVTRGTFRRVLRDECLTVTGDGRADQVFDVLAAAAAGPHDTETR